MLCSCRVPDHIRTPRNLLVDRFFTQCLVARREERRERERTRARARARARARVREGAREEKKEEKEREKKIREKKKGKAKGKTKRKEREQERESKRERERESVPSFTTHHTHTTTRHTTHTHTPHVAILAQVVDYSGILRLGWCLLLPLCASAHASLSVAQVFVESWFGWFLPAVLFSCPLLGSLSRRRRW